MNKYFPTCHDIYHLYDHKAARQITQFLSFDKLLILVGISFAPIWNLADTPITNTGQNL